MDSETRDYLDAAFAEIGTAGEILGRMLELIKDGDLEREKLAADVAELGRRVTLLDLAITGEAARRETTDAEITERITTVHREAIKALTHRAERSTTA